MLALPTPDLIIAILPQSADLVQEAGWDTLAHQMFLEHELFLDLEVPHLLVLLEFAED